jgi:hypothetical protein
MRSLYGTGRASSMGRVSTLPRSRALQLTILPERRHSPRLCRQLRARPALNFCKSLLAEYHAKKRFPATGGQLVFCYHANTVSLIQINPINVTEVIHLADN